MQSQNAKRCVDCPDKMAAQRLKSSPAERCQPLSREACHTAASGAQQPHLAGAPPFQTRLPAFQLSFPATCSDHQCIVRLELKLCNDAGKKI